jgi:hypothetical protein
MKNAMKSCLKMSLMKNVMLSKNSSSPAAGDMPYREKCREKKTNPMSCLPAGVTMSCRCCNFRYAMMNCHCCNFRYAMSLNCRRDTKYHFRVMSSCRCYSLCHLCHAMMMNYRWCSRCHAMQSLPDRDLPSPVCGLSWCCHRDLP